MVTVVRLAGVLVITWALFLATLAILRPRGIDLAEAKRLVPDLVRLLRALMGDPAVPKGVRRRLGLLLAYLALPFDLIPDFIPVLGYADDVIVVALVLRSVVRAAGADALERHWRGSERGLELLRRLCGVA